MRKINICAYHIPNYISKISLYKNQIPDLALLINRFKNINIYFVNIQIKYIYSELLCFIEKITK